ncbi:MAG: hypothetical protein N2234_05365 [Planctomycetota bacterium]|nr:hypothetical protein [Planctomycetota bacterium]
MKAEEAQMLERRFLRGVLENIQKIESIYDPLSDALLPFRYDSDALMSGDRKRKVKQRMEELGVFEKEILSNIPYDPYLRYTVTEKSFLSRGGSVVIHADCLSFWDDFIKSGESNTPINRLKVEELFLRVVEDADVFHYVAVFSPTGFDSDSKRNIPLREHTELTLVEKGEGTRWNLFFTSKSLARAIVALFDPESRQEKFQRLTNCLRECEELKVSGGFVVLDDFLAEQDIPFDIASVAIERFLASDSALKVEEIGGKKILKRRRL